MDFEKKFPNLWRAAEKYRRNAVYLDLDGENEAAFGGSKLGGAPDLPRGASWPRRKNGRALSFLAQINLAEAHPFDVRGELPEAGMLYFFYDVSEEDGMPWGFREEDADGFKVIYSAPASLERREAPDGTAAFEEAGLNCFGSEDLPDVESEIFDSADIPEAEFEAYQDEMDGMEEGQTKLLGHARCIQNPMEEECEDMAGGSGWKLLFQLNSVDDLGMMWGDDGMLYFWIREEDLKNRNFDGVWQILQCY